MRVDPGGELRHQLGAVRRTGRVGPQHQHIGQRAGRGHLEVRQRLLHLGRGLGLRFESVPDRRGEVGEGLCGARLLDDGRFLGAGGLLEIPDLPADDLGQEPAFGVGGTVFQERFDLLGRVASFLEDVGEERALVPCNESRQFVR